MPRNAKKRGPVTMPKIRRRSSTSARVEGSEVDLDDDEDTTEDSPEVFADTGPVVDGDEESEPTTIKDFDEWMQRNKYYVENRPDDYFFRIVRRHPKTGPDGEQLEGPVRQLNRPFNEAWLAEAFPHGGRFDVQLCGPKRNEKTGGTMRGVLLKVFHSVRIPQRMPLDAPSPPELAPPMSWDYRRGELFKGVDRLNDDDDDDDDDDEDNPTEESVENRLEASLANRLADMAFKSMEQRDRKIETLERQLLRPPLPAPPPVHQPKSADETVMTLLGDITKSIISRPVESKADQEEVNRLHQMIKDLQSAHHREITDRQDRAQRELTERLTEQRQHYEAMLSEERSRHEKRVDDLRITHTSAMEQLREAQAEKITDLKEAITELKADKRQAESDARQAERDLMTVRSDFTALKSELAAYREGAEIRLDAAVTKAKAEMQPKSESDPMESLVKSVNSAKGLMETLGQSLGVAKETSKDIEPAAPSSRLDKGIEIAQKLAGSKEIRGLASSVTKAASEGFAAIVQSREAAARQKNPTTEDIIKKYEALERGKAPKIDTKQIEARNKVEDERRNVVRDVSPEPTEEESLLASLGIDPAQLKQNAEEMLDAVEDHASMDDPIDEAAEDMIELLQKTFKQPREGIIDQIADASAKETLKELGHDESRLSAKALSYLDEMIAHVRSLR